MTKGFNYYWLKRPQLLLLLIIMILLILLILLLLEEIKGSTTPSGDSELLCRRASNYVLVLSDHMWRVCLILRFIGFVIKKTCSLRLYVASVSYDEIRSICHQQILVPFLKQPFAKFSANFSQSSISRKNPSKNKCPAVLYIPARKRLISLILHK